MTHLRGVALMAGAVGALLICVAFSGQAFAGMEEEFAKARTEEEQLRQNHEFAQRNVEAETETVRDRQGEVQRLVDRQIDLNQRIAFFQGGLARTNIAPVERRQLQADLARSQTEVQRVQVRLVEAKREVAESTGDLRRAIAAATAANTAFIRSFGAGLESQSRPVQHGRASEALDATRAEVARSTATWGSLGDRQGLGVVLARLQAQRRLVLEEGRAGRLTTSQVAAGLAPIDARARQSLRLYQTMGQHYLDANAHAGEVERNLLGEAQALPAPTNQYESVADAIREGGIPNEYGAIDLTARDRNDNNDDDVDDKLPAVVPPAPGPPPAPARRAGRARLYLALQPEPSGLPYAAAPSAAPPQPPAAPGAAPARPRELIYVQLPPEDRLVYVELAAQPVPPPPQPAPPPQAAPPPVPARAHLVLPNTVARRVAPAASAVAVAPPARAPARGGGVARRAAEIARQLGDKPLRGGPPPAPGGQ